MPALTANRRSEVSGFHRFKASLVEQSRGVYPMLSMGEETHVFLFEAEANSSPSFALGKGREAL